METKIAREMQPYLDAIEAAQADAVRARERVAAAQAEAARAALQLARGFADRAASMLGWHREKFRRAARRAGIVRAQGRPHGYGKAVDVGKGG